MLNNIELNQIGTQFINEEELEYKTIAYYNYTPISSTGKIIVEYHSTYITNSNSGLYFNSITVDDNEIASGFQKFPYGSGPLFPIVGEYHNTSGSSKLIEVKVKNVTGNAGLDIESNNSTWMRITEIT